MYYFSIVIPCFNSEATITKVLNSCLNQTIQNYQIVIVDDNSRYELFTFIKTKSELYEALRERLVVYRNKTNRGVSFSRNRGWDLAKGKYVCFLDSDDIWHPSKLEIIYRFCIREEPNVLFHSYESNSLLFKQYYSDKIHQIKKMKWNSIILRNPSQTSCYTILRTIKDRFNEEMSYSEDYELWLRMSLKYDFLKIEGPPLTRLLRPPKTFGGLSAKRIDMRIGEIKAYKNYLNLLNMQSIFPLMILFSIVKHVLSESKYYLFIIKTKCIEPKIHNIIM